MLYVLLYFVHMIQLVARYNMVYLILVYFFIVQILRIKNKEKDILIERVPYINYIRLILNVLIVRSTLRTVPISQNLHYMHHLKSRKQKQNQDNANLFFINITCHVRPSPTHPCFNLNIFLRDLYFRGDYRSIN